jgi:hypothetical protein
MDITIANIGRRIKNSLMKKFEMDLQFSYH